jgi:hypothetical protein
LKAIAAQGQWFALIDTAQDQSLHALVTASAQSQCLISGALPQALAAALPYIVRVNAEDPLMKQWRSRGLGKNWGIMLESDSDIDYLRVHFKKFLNVRLPDGTVALFRFYDPRIFRTYMLSASPEEREPWFRGVMRYSVESENPGDTHEFHINEGQLQVGAKQR